MAVAAPQAHHHADSVFRPSGESHRSPTGVVGHFEYSRAGTPSGDVPVTYRRDPAGHGLLPQRHEPLPQRWHHHDHPRDRAYTPYHGKHLSLAVAGADADPDFD